MANQLQLQRQIQDEIDQEAKMEKQMKNVLKRFFKKYKQFKLVDKKEDSDAVLIFRKDRIGTYRLALTKGDDPFSYLAPSEADLFMLYYIKNKNNHDSNLSTFGHIKRRK